MARVPNLEVMHKYYHLPEGNAEKVNDDDINKILSNFKKNGGAIISARRTLNEDGSIPEDLMNEYTKWVTDTDNEDKEAFIKNYSLNKTKELISDLAHSQFTHSPVYGGYKEDNIVIDLYEPSFLIYCFDRKGNNLNFEELKEFAIELGEKYKNSVYIGDSKINVVWSYDKNYVWYKNPKATDYSGNYLTYARGEIVL